MNGTHSLAYVEDVNLICNDIRTIERNADVLLNACKDVGFSSKPRENYVHGDRTSSSRDST